MKKKSNAVCGGDQQNLIRCLLHSWEPQDGAKLHYFDLVQKNLTFKLKYASAAAFLFIWEKKTRNGQAARILLSEPLQ